MLWILQSDAYQATGCYNLLCSGFIQISNQIAMGASIFPISNYGGSQYDINILVWKVNSKKLSHAEHTTNQIHEWTRRESVVPTCLLFFLKAPSGLSQGYNCGSGPVCGHTRSRVTVGPRTNQICLQTRPLIMIAFFNNFPQEYSPRANVSSVRKSYPFLPADVSNLALSISNCVMALPCAIILFFHGFLKFR